MDTMQKSDYTMEYQMCAKYDKLRLITQDFRKKRAKNALNVGENDLEWILCPSTFDVFRSKEKKRKECEMKTKSFAAQKDQFHWIQFQFAKRKAEFRWSVS